jgi:hypothetical protein
LLGGGSSSNEDLLVLGLAPTAAIAVIGLPTGFYLFVAAIQKGIAETELDDEAFRRR